MAEKKQFKFTSKAQFDFFQKNKPNLFDKVQKDNPVDRSKLPERLHEKDLNVIRIPMGNDKVYDWRMDR